jgi:hypothetical protein
MLDIFLIGTAFLLESFTELNFSLKDVITLTSLFSVFSVITLAIFLRGQSREPASQAMHTLVSIGLKFLLDMVLALLWFFISKKGSIISVFVFFVLYLTLTLFTIFVILKELKNRSL